MQRPPSRIPVRRSGSKSSSTWSADGAGVNDDDVAILPHSRIVQAVQAASDRAELPRRGAHTHGVDNADTDAEMTLQSSAHSAVMSSSSNIRDGQDMTHSQRFRSNHARSNGRTVESWSATDLPMHTGPVNAAPPARISRAVSSDDHVSRDHVDAIGASTVAPAQPGQSEEHEHEYALVFDADVDSDTAASSRGARALDPGVSARIGVKPIGDASNGAVNTGVNHGSTHSASVTPSVVTAATGTNQADGSVSSSRPYPQRDNVVPHVDRHAVSAGGVRTAVLNSAPHVTVHSARRSASSARSLSVVGGGGAGAAGTAEDEEVSRMFIKLELIGEGSFGKVYKGRRRYSGQLVALKCIVKAGKTERDLINLRQEIAILRKLSHPNCIRMLDWFETAEDICVVTEYAQGELFEVLQSDENLSESTVRAIAQQLVAALYYLHSHRVIHRDMKPQNILIGTQATIKLCDFGFARLVSPHTLMLTSIKGTPLYMAPELVQEQPYNDKVDLWSMGVILYELYVGKPPFYATNIIALIKSIVRQPVEYPAAMSPEFRSFLDGLLQKDPRNRLGWPNLLQHPFITGRANVEINSSV